MSSLSTKEFRVWAVFLLLATVMGIVILLYPSRPSTSVDTYHFMATHIGTKASVKKDLIRTQAELDSVKKDPRINGRQYADIGATVGRSDVDMFVMSINDMKANYAVLEDMADAPEKTSYDVYEFIPDVIQINPSKYQAQKIADENILQKVKLDQTIKFHEIATVGSYVVLSPDNTYMFIVTPGETAWSFSSLIDTDKL